MIVYKYRVWCSTDNKWTYVWSEDGANAPSVCPENNTHSIDPAKTSLVKKAGDEIIETAPAVVQGGKKLTNVGTKFNVTAGQTFTHSYHFTKEIYIKDGFVITDNNVVGDQVTVALVDHDNLLGAGAGYVLHKFLEDFPVFKDGHTEFKHEAMTEMNMQGFYMDITYKSTGAQDIVCAVGSKGYS